MDLLSTDPQYTEPGTVEYFMEAVMRQQNQVSLALLTGPVVPAASFASGGNKQEIAATQISAVLEAWLFTQAIGASPTAAQKFMAKQIVKQAITPYAAAGLAVGTGIALAMDVHSDSTQLEKTASLGGVSYGKTQKQKSARLGGL